MKRIRFEGVIQMEADQFGDFKSAEHVVDVALYYGDKHQDFATCHTKVGEVEDWEEDS